MKLLASSLVALTALTLVGCDTKPLDYQDPFFPAEGRPNTVDLTVNRMIVAGAAEEATLSKHHFDGEALNSLGMKKLAAIVEGRKTNLPVTVYLNLTGDEAKLSAAREKSIRSALINLGVTETDAMVKMGSNPAVTGSAATATKSLKTIEGGGEEGGEGAEAGAAPGAPAK
jgi:hypothetical protein